jgi:hypothetical protein
LQTIDSRRRRCNTTIEEIRSIVCPIAIAIAVAPVPLPR